MSEMMAEVEKVIVEIENGHSVNYCGVSEMASRSGMSRSWIKRLAQYGLIPGAFKIGMSWVIPANWECNSHRIKTNKNTAQEGKKP